jgi:hypothetical protein
MISNAKFVNLEAFKERADLVIVTCPHTEYKSLKFEVPIIDVWDFYGKGSGI